MSWFTDDEIHNMKADAYSETERGHSDVAHLDYAELIEQRIMTRMAEALGRSRRWARTPDEKYAYNNTIYALYQEDVIGKEMFDRYFIVIEH